ncbi:MAG TPA: hypothetical protein VN706_22990 [Gemmatimonadaceae bacterium]|nr:hypothetical protein [Gemmatimonadaceae bacterium]
MYSTCLVCNQSLGSNESIEHFPVGRRLAFDAAKGRLWVVCTRCDQWNLSPLEERWEAIEECERAYRATFVRVSTDNVGLARIGEGIGLIRIGAPLRPEFAAWRYGRQLATRRRKARYVAGAGLAAAAISGIAMGPAIAPALALGTISIVVIPGVTTIMGVVPMLGMLAARDYIEHDRVIARLSLEGRVLKVRAKHANDIELGLRRHEDDAVVTVPHDSGWVEFRGGAAIHATARVVSGANRFGASDARVQDAVQQIEDAGDAAGFLATAGRKNSWRSGRFVSLLNSYRRIGALKLSSTERLALEMAVHEEGERRVMEGELAALEDARRDAEQIAAISDVDLTPPRLYE